MSLDVADNVWRYETNVKLSVSFGAVYSLLLLIRDKDALEVFVCFCSFSPVNDDFDSWCHPNEPTKIW